ncbi:hypothetical protein SANA_18620 [Gottschalkiaceae bacterium SANA]|nr:hypothetical protein SANA_18620 [Gottschalkiaceae bacterium SANA]
MRTHDLTVNQLIIPELSFNPYFKNKNTPYLFFDIETLGFHRRLHPLVMIGLLIVTPGEAPKGKQWLLDSEEEEPALIQSFFDEIQADSVLVSFNGKRFDWPFLVSRAKKHHILPPQVKNHLDLYDFYQGGFPLLHAENHTLRTLTSPEFTPQSCPSKEIPNLLRSHLRGGDPEAALTCFQHNEDDLIALLYLERKMFHLREKWQILNPELLTLSKIQKSKDFYLVRYWPSDLARARTLVKQDKNFSVDYHTHNEFLEIRFRYLPIQENEVIYHTLPQPWYPFPITNMQSQDQTIDLPDGLFLVSTDTQVDHSSIHQFCREILTYIQKE